MNPVYVVVQMLHHHTTHLLLQPNVTNQKNLQINLLSLSYKTTGTLKALLGSLPQYWILGAAKCFASALSCPWLLSASILVWKKKGPYVDIHSQLAQTCFHTSSSQNPFSEPEVKSHLPNHFTQRTPQMT